MILKLKRTPGIYLVGFMASGKSTVGRLLAKELGWPFHDLDHDIEAEQGRAISEIFDTLGEAAFRQMETEALRRKIRRVQSGRPLVLAVGGGAFVQPANYELVRDNGVSIWLDCALDIVEQRLQQQNHRPLARRAETWRELYLSRREAYAKADYRISIEIDDSEWAVRRILELPLF